MFLINNMCNSANILSIIYMAKQIIKILQIGVPIILIIMIMLDIFKSTIGANEEDIKKGTNNIKSRLLAAALVFFVPLIVNFTINILSDYDIKAASCYEYATLENIKSLRENENNGSYIIESPVKVDNDDDENDNTAVEQVNGNMEVHFINVGRFDAILIRTNNKTIFIDSGTYSKGDISVNYLKELGITKIDVMIGSHIHYNHIQGQAKILDNFKVGEIYYGDDIYTCVNNKSCNEEDIEYIKDAIEKYNTKVTIMKPDDKVNIGSMVLEFTGPIKYYTFADSSYPQNLNSLNFILTYGNSKFMFTGDYVQDNEILERYDAALLNIDVLKYPHHGQATLSSEFINATSPEAAVLLNGQNKLSSGMTSKLKNINTKIYVSGTDKNIVMITDGKSIKIFTNASPSDYKR